LRESYREGGQFMRALTLVFMIILTAASLGTLLPRARALAAEDDGASGAMKRALPEWFNRQSREYYTMPQFVVPIIEGNTVTRQVALLVTLETMGTANREKLVANRQRLQDIFLRDMYGTLAVRRPDGQSYDAIIKARLQRAGDQVMGAGIIDDVFVKATYDRPIAPAKR
jgi:hypothetical protein